MTGSEVVFDGASSRDDWGLTISSVELRMPEPKTASVDVPGSDGALDLSEALAGGPTYGTRRLAVEFRKDHPSRAAAVATAAAVAAAVHGRRMRIEVPDYPGGWLRGRCSVSATYLPSNTVRLRVEAECDPYVLTGSRSATLPPGQPSLSDGFVAHPGEGFALGAGTIEASFAEPDAYYTAAARALDVHAAGTANLLDASACPVRLMAAREDLAYTKSTVMGLSGQRVAFGETATTWTERAVSAKIGRASCRERV